MGDDEIVELFWKRSEAALTETERKYSKYCHSIAFGILRCKEDAEECVNDTLARVWNAITPARPSVLRTFLGKITRKLGIPEWAAYNYGNSRKGYWRMAGTTTLNNALSNERLAQGGYFDISQKYKSLHLCD